jgi:hypothetical protein
MYTDMLANNSIIDTTYNNPSAKMGTIDGIFIGIGRYDVGNPKRTIKASKNTFKHINILTISSCLSLDLLLCIFLFPS